MHVEDLADLPLDRVQRVERGHRLLEDHGDLVAAHLAQRLLVGGEQLLSLEEDRAGRVMRRRVGQELQDRERRHRLARAGFADQRHRLLLADVERDAAHRMHDAVAGAELDMQVADGEEGGGVMPAIDSDRRHLRSHRGSSAAEVVSLLSDDRNTLQASRSSSGDMDRIRQLVSDRRSDLRTARMQNARGSIGQRRSADRRSETQRHVLSQRERCSCSR